MTDFAKLISVPNKSVPGAWRGVGRGGSRSRRGGGGEGHTFASLEIPKLANAQPSNFGPLPYFMYLYLAQFYCDFHNTTIE